MRKMDLLDHFQMIATAKADRGGRPFSDPVHGQYAASSKGEGKKAEAA